MIVVHNRDRPEIFQNSLIKRTLKAAFQAFDLSIKYQRRLKLSGSSRALPFEVGGVEYKYLWGSHSARSTLRACSPSRGSGGMPPQENKCF